MPAHVQSDMKTSAKGVAKRLLFSLFVAASLGGCAVYDPGYGGYGAYGAYSGYSYYGDPVHPVAPVYGYGPAPFYAAPHYLPNPVLQFNYRSGGGYRRHDGGGRGWRGGDHRFHDGRDRGQHRGQRGEGRGDGRRGGHDRRN